MLHAFGNACRPTTDWYHDRGRSNSAHSLQFALARRAAVPHLFWTVNSLYPI